MIKLGLISENAANSDSNERIILYDMWRILEGDQKEEVAVEDAKVMVMAILRIHDHKRIGATYEDAGQNSHRDHNKVGFFNYEG